MDVEIDVVGVEIVVVMVEGGKRAPHHNVRVEVENKRSPHRNYGVGVENRRSPHRNVVALRKRAETVNSGDRNSRSPSRQFGRSENMKYSKEIFRTPVPKALRRSAAWIPIPITLGNRDFAKVDGMRSEERRVGKECRL